MSLQDDFREGQLEAVGILRSLGDATRRVIGEVDRHPVGHIGVELVRARVDGRQLSIREVMELIDEASRADIRSGR